VDISALQFRAMTNTDEDFRLFQECFAANKSPKTLDLIRWQFREPPEGRLYVEFAVIPGDRPSLAAIYASFPVPMQLDGANTVGVQSIDTLTDERFRGKGLFTKMAKALYERCAADGVRLVYGFPNGNSVHGFSKLNWKSLDPVPYRFKPLRASYLARRVSLTSGLAPILGGMPLTMAAAARPKRGQRLESVTSFDRRFDDVWEKFSRGTRVAVRRTAEYLAWRVRRPAEAYETVALLEDDKLRGYVIIGVNDVGPSSVGKIMELVFDPAYPAVENTLVTEAIRQLYTRGCEVAWTSSFSHSPNYGAFRRNGFIPAPQRLTVEAHMGARSLQNQQDELLGDREAWYVSFLDSDTH
jgi:GNAT superfamily N-acetyltransferase